MKTRVPTLLLAAVAVLSAPVLIAQEAVLEKRSGVAARRILNRSDKVIIAGFRVAFNTEGASSASTGAKAVSSDATVSLKVNLSGVTGDDFQRITEEAYADFKAQLATAGVTVLGADVLKVSRSYGELTFTPSTKERPYVKDMGAGAGRTVVVYTPAELPFFLSHYDGGNLGPVTMDLGNWRALNQLSVETKAVVLVPTVIIEFVKMRSGGRGKILRNDAEVGADPQIALVGKQSNVAVFHAKIRLAGDLGDFHIAEDLEVPGAFGTLRQVAATDNAAPNSSLVLLTDQPGRGSSRTAHVIAADPAAFSQLTLQGLKSFNRAAGDFIAAK